MALFLDTGYHLLAAFEQSYLPLLVTGMPKDSFARKLGGITMPITTPLTVELKDLLQPRQTLSGISLHFSELFQVSPFYDE